MVCTENMFREHVSAGTVPRTSMNARDDDGDAAADDDEEEEEDDRFMISVTEYIV